MGKTFEALNRAEEQRRLRFNLTPVDDNGFERGKLTLLLSHEANRIYEQKLNQMEQTVGELNKMLSGLITSMKESMGGQKSEDRGPRVEERDLKPEA